MRNKTIWLCRAGKNGEFENKFIEDERIYITWKDLPIPLDSFKEQSQLKKYLTDMDPSFKENTAKTWASQFFAFAKSMEKGDIVALPSKIYPVIHFGEITGNYCYMPGKGENAPMHYRTVNWKWKSVPRSAFDQDVLYSLGAFMTICRIKHSERIMTVLTADKVISNITTPDSGIQQDTSIDIEGAAYDEISNMLISKTKGHKMADIIAAILRAKGYTTYVSPPGPDNGVDILASRGSFGFEQPHICVQVKTSDAPLERAVLDQMLGAMRNFEADYGLLVSWSGFKSSIERERAKQFFRVRLWDHKDIVKEFLNHYDELDDEIKQLIPLKKIWVVKDNHTA